MTTVNDCKIISFHHVLLGKGDLTSLNCGAEINFQIKRIYYLTGVGTEETRGNHANLNNQQVMVAIRGSFSVTLNDGEVRRTFLLDSHQRGLLVREGIWRSVHDFSEDAICLVICSEGYDPNDYIKTHSDFLKMRGV